MRLLLFFYIITSSQTLAIYFQGHFVTPTPPTHQPILKIEHINYCTKKPPLLPPAHDIMLSYIGIVMKNIVCCHVFNPVYMTIWLQALHLITGSPSDPVSLIKFLFDLEL